LFVTGENTDFISVENVKSSLSGKNIVLEDVHLSGRLVEIDIVESLGQQGLQLTIKKEIIIKSKVKKLGIKKEPAGALKLISNT
jgi:hypothetical protein